MNRNIVIGMVVALFIVGGGALFLFKGDKADAPAVETSTADPNKASTNPAGDSGSASSDLAANVVTYTDGGFVPAKITVTAGTIVTISNISTNSLQFNSDPHPTHTENSELNIGAIAKGESQTFTPSKTGTWGFHNHFSPSDKGTIVVE